MATRGEVRVRTVAENTTQTAAELRKVSRATRSIGEEALWSGRKSRHSMSLITEGFKGMGSAVGLTGVAFGIKDLAQAGMNLQHQQAQLRLATHGNVGAYNALDAAAVKSSEHGGFSRDEELQSMTQLMAATHSQTETLQANTAAVALARHEGLSYASAQHYMNQAVVGNVNRLKQYIGYINPVKDAEFALGQAHRVNVIGLEAQAKAMGKSGPAWLKQQELLAGITPQMHAAAVEQDKLATGQATLNKILSDPAFANAQSAYDKTLQGKVTNLKHTFQEVTGQIGMTLIPAMTKVVGVGLKVVDFLSKAHWAAVSLAAVVTTLGAIAFGRMLWGGLMYALSPLMKMYKYMQEYKRATDVAKGSTIALAGAEDVAAGSSAALAGTTTAVSVAEGEAAASGGILAAAMGGLAIAIDVVTGAWVLLVSVSPLIILMAISFAIYEMITHWKQVKEAAGDALKWMGNAASWAWGKIKQGFEMLWQAGGRPFRMIASSAQQAFHDAVHFSEQAWTNIKRGADLAVKWIKHAWQDMTSFITKPIHFGGHGPLADVANFVMNPFGRFNPSQGHYAGGPVSAVGGSIGATDTVPTMLTPGEGVLNRAAMQQIGDRGLNRLNEGLGLGGGQMHVTITPSPANFYVDGRLLARALVRYTLEKAARGPSSLSGGALVTGV